MLRIVTQGDDSFLPSPEPLLLRAEIDHRVANSLALISGLVHGRAKACEKCATMTGADAASAFREIAGQIDSLARLSRLLSQQPGDEMVNISEHLRNVCAAISATLAHTPMSVQADFDVEYLVHEAQVLPISLIVNEVITNAAKYAHPSGIAGIITVECAPAWGGGLTVTIADDGVGFPEGFDPARSQGLGFRVIRALAKQLRARWSFETSPMGVAFQLELPA